jgi:N-acetylmuramoyl-L-alanine amidase
MALKRVWIPTSNFNAGYQMRRLIVLHSSEGAQTYQSLGNYFATGTKQASSHVGIDNAVDGTIGEYVKDANTAWTAANANPVAVQAELCTPSGASANWKTADWMARPIMLKNAAEWIKEESWKFTIPIRKLTPAQAQGNGAGVCQHMDLGVWGGAHHDCGPGFPIDYVISLALGTIITTPTKADDDTMVIEFGADSKAGIPVPKDATHFRVSTAQTANLGWSWPGTTSKGTMVLGGNTLRVDVPLANGQTGLIVITKNGATGPVYGCWIIA